jgi:opacity protein-like surface antigen
MREGDAMKKTGVLALSVIFLLGLGSTASAKGWDLGVKGGVYQGVGDFGDSVKSSFGLSFYYERELIPSLSLQARFSRHLHGVSADYQRFAGVGKPGGGSDVTGDVTINELALDLKWTLPFSPKWSAFLIGGIGSYFWNVEAIDVSADPTLVSSGDGTDVGLNGGVGLEYMINPEVSVGLEADYTHIFGDFDDGFLTFSGNIIFHFGRDLYH